MPEVLCLRPLADFQRADALPPATLNVSYRAPDDPQLAQLIREADALVIPAVGGRLPSALFRGSKVKLVQVTGAGVDRLEEAAMKELGIAVANVPGGSSNAVAQYVIAAALVLLRRLTWADREIRQGSYVSFRGRMLLDNLPGLEGLTAGVIGLGTVGTAVAAALRAFGMNILYRDPARETPPPEVPDARSVAFDDLLKLSDVVTLHVPLLPQTRSMIGAKQLGLMKRGAVLINAARGGVVNETALAHYLNSGHLGGAAVDVFSTEPPDDDNPLLTLEGEGARRLLLTPHIAGVTRQSAAMLFTEAWANVERVLVRGEAPRYRVY